MVRRSVALVLLCIGVLYAVPAMASADTGEIIEPQGNPPSNVDGWQAGTCFKDQPVEGEPKIHCGPQTGEDFFKQAGGHPPVGFTQYTVQHEPAGTIGPVAPIPTGDDTLAVNLPAAQIPDGLEPGRQIVLVDNTPPPTTVKSSSGASAAPAPIPTYKATIVSISGTKLTLAVDHAQAPAIEQLADGGKFGITIPPAGS